MSDKSFKRWMKAVDAIVKKKINHNLDDLPDEPYRLYFTEHYLAKDMAKIVIQHLNDSVEFLNSLYE